MIDKIVYMDNAATTRVDDDVLAEMILYMSELYANSSSSHDLGVKVNNDVKRARENVARLLNTYPDHITFTSGATESLNTIIKGLASANRSRRNQIITVGTEHSAVLNTCKFLESQGIEIIYLPVLETGLVNENILNEVISEKTLLVCVMLANNETGVIQPIRKICELAHRVGAYFLTDATQAVGKIPIDVVELGIDFLVFSGHKFHGPKGIGGYYYKEKTVKMDALIHGGGQEESRRSGTLNVPGIIGLGKSSQIAIHNMKRDEQYVKELRDLLELELLKFKGTFINGHRKLRLFNITNICIPNIEADVFIKMLGNICVSNGSACHSALIEPSHVLSEMGLGNSEAFSSIRFSLSKYNTREEIYYTVDKINKLIY
ncbi:cysteine desulfurase family protein [Chryseobacterium arthrosphaerae]|uniref:cysteine desulfurase family protein n=1 Tax=Chryseobacterium arthrosphaerae TaxID=651561 RepID=UPI001F4B85BC|nr:cysteine desulfurase family protein [Chryseobacterium arthrosphaerae]